MARAVMPEWVVPSFEAVASVRHSAAGAAVGDGSWRGIAQALDWVAGIEPVAPLTGYRDEPLRVRVLAECLCAYELVTGRPAVDADYERLGDVPLAPDEAHMDPAYASGVWETLTWLLGESQHAPGLRFRRGDAAG